jgi:hypothetical protein
VKRKVPVACTFEIETSFCSGGDRRLHSTIEPTVIDQTCAKCRLLFVKFKLYEASNRIAKMGNLSG